MSTSQLLFECVTFLHFLSKFFGHRQTTVHMRTWLWRPQCFPSTVRLASTWSQTVVTLHWMKLRLITVGVALAVGRTGSFWVTQIQNSNCQQIKAQGEKSLQMFPGNINISKWLKLLCWGNACAGRFFTWNNDLQVCVQTSKRVYEPQKLT